jgi:hypothetical protein
LFDVACASAFFRTVFREFRPLVKVIREEAIMGNYEVYQERW